MTDNQNDTHFSLTLGGPVYQFYLRTGLAKKPLLFYKRRMVIISLFAWLPLFILAMLGGVAFSSVKIPFIEDMDVHTRFLISLPLLIYAEYIVNERLPIIIRQFSLCQIISPKDQAKFNSIITSAVRSTHSVAVEIGLLIVVFIVGQWISNKYFSSNVSAWYASSVNGTIKLTLTGYWYIFVSVPLFQFLLLRWYYRMFIWYRFLWQISKLPLQLNSLHPDKAGGLGFLTESIYAFAPLLLAHSVLLAGLIFNRIWHANATLSQFQGEIIVTMVFLLCLPLIPLIFFISSLVKIKRIGTLEYDVVANRYVNEFHKKWIEPKTSHKELLGAPDIQSLADLGNSFAVSAEMRVLPFSRRSIMAVVVLIALPLFPLIFTIMPVDKIIHQLVGIVF